MDPLNAPWCWNTYLQNWVIFRANVGKSSSTMDDLWMVIQQDTMIYGDSEW